MSPRRAVFVGSILVSSACAAQKPAPPPPLPPPLPTAAPTAPPAPKRYDALERASFNQLAMRLNLPLFWQGDTNANRAPDPGEVRALMFYPTAPTWVRGNEFSPEFELAYTSLLAAAHPSPKSESPEEAARRALLLDELDQGKPTLVYNDLRRVADHERRAIRSLLMASVFIDRVYAIQTGAAALAQRVPRDDPASQSLFRRNWGPKCEGPRTEKNPSCSAIPGAPKAKVDVYPDALQDEPRFCETLEKRKDAKDLLAPFVAVRENAGTLVAQKYSDAYRAPLAAAAAHMLEAAAALGADEAPFAAYLRAAAKACGDNDWEAADEAWSKMSGQSSKYYLRIGPDETYWEPCSQKAGFHVSFARINRDSLAWQQKLNPLQQSLEQSFAKLIGFPYRERKVSFRLPDFIDVVWNAGDSRQAFGATVGQSLPNWGKVADESRGRTVAMSNLYNDPDTLKMRREQAAALLDAAGFALVNDEPTAGLLSTILHEATHNLGPSHEYKFAGKTDNLAFGGALSSTLEELKAQTGALFYLELLAKKGVITPELQRQAYVDSVIWAFGHIAQGMYNEHGQRKPYSQLSAVQIGFLLEEGALVFVPTQPAANGRDSGAFTFVFDKFPAACEKLMQKVGKLKAINDRAGAEALTKRYVEGDRVPQSTIAERVLRQPKNTFVYAVDL